MGTRIIVFCGLRIGKPPLIITIRSGFPNNFYLILAARRTKSESFLLLERLFDSNRDGDGSADHGREMLEQHFGWDPGEPPVAVRNHTHGSREETNYFFSASSTATATATVAPTMGLLPMPRKPIIST